MMRMLRIEIKPGIHICCNSTKKQEANELRTAMIDGVLSNAKRFENESINSQR